MLVIVFTIATILRTLRKLLLHAVESVKRNHCGVVCRSWHNRGVLGGYRIEAGQVHFGFAGVLRRGKGKKGLSLTNPFLQCSWCSMRMGLL